MEVNDFKNRDLKQIYCSCVRGIEKFKSRERASRRWY